MTCKPPPPRYELSYDYVVEHRINDWPEIGDYYPPKARKHALIQLVDTRAYKDGECFVYEWDDASKLWIEKRWITKPPKNRKKKNATPV